MTGFGRSASGSRRCADRAERIENRARRAVLYRHAFVYPWRELRNRCHGPCRQGSVGYDIADVMKIPVGTVKSRLSAARTALNRTLEEKVQNR